MQSNQNPAKHFHFYSWSNGAVFGCAAVTTTSTALEYANEQKCGFRLILSPYEKCRRRHLVVLFPVPREAA